MRRALLLLLLALLPACAGGSAGSGGSGAGAPAGGPDRTADARGVLEAVFRYQFDHNDSGLKERAAAYCLCVPDGEGRRGERDPEPALLDLLRGRKPPVLPCSACRVEGGRVVETREGRPALTFRIAALRWRGRDEAEVEGGYAEGNLSASGQRYRVVRGEAGWKVADVRGLWIS